MANITIQVDDLGQASVLTTSQETIGVTLSQTASVVSGVPSGWAEMVAEYGIGYNYPQPTGQTTSYRTGDDANIEATIFTAAVRAANGLKPRQSLASFSVLNNNNAFGNKNRFTDSVGGQTYTLKYIIDHYTGLGWGKSTGGRNYGVSWNQTIDNGLSETVAGFSDYFAKNANQIMSLQEFNGIAGLPAIFNTVMSVTDAQAADNWTSTNAPFASPLRAVTYSPVGAATLGALVMTTTSWATEVMFCRKHY